MRRKKSQTVAAATQSVHVSAKVRARAQTRTASAMAGAMGMPFSPLAGGVSRERGIPLASVRPPFSPHRASARDINHPITPRRQDAPTTTSPQAGPVHAPNAEKSLTSPPPTPHLPLARRDAHDAPSKTSSTTTIPTSASPVQPASAARARPESATATEHSLGTIRHLRSHADATTSDTTSATWHASATQATIPISDRLSPLCSSPKRSPPDAPPQAPPRGHFCPQRSKRASLPATVRFGTSRGRFV